VDALPEIAASSSGLKALCTYLAWAGIEDCRKCCGGNGYLMVSGIAPLAADYVWQTTAEGDWIILMLQTARFLLKCLKDAMEGKTLAGPVAYLSALRDTMGDVSKAAPPQAKSTQDFFNVDYLQQLFNYCAIVSVATVGQDFQQKLAEANGKFDEAWNASALSYATLSEPTQ